VDRRYGEDSAKPYGLLGETRIFRDEHGDVGLCHPPAGDRDTDKLGVGGWYYGGLSEPTYPWTDAADQRRQFPARSGGFTELVGTTVAEGLLHGVGYRGSPGGVAQSGAVYRVKGHHDAGTIYGGGAGGKKKYHWNVQILAASKV